ncbi:hypothetical protein DBA26_05335, partial [Brucella canis]
GRQPLLTLFPEEGNQPRNFATADNSAVAFHEQPWIVPLFHMACLKMLYPFRNGWACVDVRH